jgi:uncharacterized protein (TIGR03067 family)
VAELQKFQGRWQKVDNNKFELRFDGQKMTQFYNGVSGNEGKIVIDPTKAPATLDLTWTLAAYAGKTSFGIYRFTEAGNLEICMNQPSTKKTDTRPTIFSDKPNVGSGSVLYVLKKVGN